MKTEYGQYQGKHQEQRDGSCGGIEDCINAIKLCSFALLLKSRWKVLLKEIRINAGEPEVLSFLFHTFFLLCPHCRQCNFAADRPGILDCVSHLTSSWFHTYRLLYQTSAPDKSDSSQSITRGSSDRLQTWTLEPQQAFLHFFICSRKFNL